jgi:lysophospholipase L1-like esterase
VNRLRLLLAIAVLPLSLAAETRWIVTWATSPAPQLATQAEMVSAKMVFNNQTLREIVHTSVGGSTCRVRMSNAFGKEPLQINAARIALRATAAEVVGGTDRPITFGGRESVTIPPDAVLMSDPITLEVPAGGDIAISVYLARSTNAGGIHYSANATSYIGAGNQTQAVAFRSSTTVSSWAFLAGVDVAAPETAASAATIVAFGDSITDGSRSTANANRRWADFLAARLRAAGRNDIGVANAGISGNRVYHNAINNVRFSVNALARFGRDVLEQPGARYVIILEGINDIGQPGTGSAAAAEAVDDIDIITGLKQMAERAHALGFKVIGATLTPFSVYTGADYYSDMKNAQRQAVNYWIRNSGVFDHVVDFDYIVRDPARPDSMLADYDSGDHLHPGDAGYKAMADAIDLTWFR